METTVQQFDFKKSILVIDDEPVNGMLLRELLEPSYKVYTAGGGKSGLDMATSLLPDLIILDVRMPEMNGYEVCARLRKEERTRLLPVLILTGLNSVDDRIEAFYKGADDFISKPFSSEEILARIHGKLSRFETLRSRKRESRGKIQCCNLLLNLESMRLSIGNENVDLSLTEFKLLKFLIENKGKALSRQAILDEVWPGVHVLKRNIDNHIVTLRGKLSRFQGGIETIYQVGYSLHCGRKLDQACGGDK